MEEVQHKLSLIGEEIFIKFFDINDEKYADNLINYGQLYFREVSEFIDNHDKDRGDNEEYLLTKNKNWILLYKSPSDYEYKVFYKPNENSDIRGDITNKIYCITEWKKSKLLEFNGVNSIAKDFIKGFSSCGGLVCIVVDKNKFIEKCEYYFDNNSINYDYDSCIYEDLDEKSDKYFFSSKARFRKKTSLKYQSEFRFILKEYWGNNIINIGSLEDFAIKLYLFDLNNDNFKNKIVID